MNLPNKLTLMRIFMVPIVVVLLLTFDGLWADIVSDGSGLLP